METPPGASVRLTASDQRPGRGLADGLYIPSHGNAGQRWWLKVLADLKSLFLIRYSYFEKTLIMKNMPVGPQPKAAESVPPPNYLSPNLLCGRQIRTS
ncbi:hypothetical protein H4Q32_028791 [Labeo rohita]|uniref:Uncharacterized protein n=1 Tax=Labeo rohita TaxID=84645 RepID=A0ABQ8LA09_LABRO|nr:hypothetical protein H4Q32_028791 [Labeo rohita]